jgi:hypothetical protein
MMALSTVLGCVASVIVLRQDVVTAIEMACVAFACSLLTKDKAALAPAADGGEAQAMQDARSLGIGIMRDGQRIDPMDFYAEKPHETRA